MALPLRRLFRAVVPLFSLARVGFAYDLNAPVSPMTYTDAQKAAQSKAGQAIVHQINATLAAHGTAFTVPPGVYRIPADGPDSALNLSHVKNFTLHLAGAEFILGNGGTFIAPDDCENLAFLGPAKFDSEVQTITQGRLLTYDPNTGLSTVEILPGYEVTHSDGSTVDAFSPAGVYLENPSWAGYKNMTVMDPAKRRVQVTLGAKDAGFTRLYKPGVLLAFRLHGSPLFVSAGGSGANGLTLKDLDLYTSSGFAWGNGRGNWKFIHVRGIRRPGTNRLMGVGGCQTANFGGNVTFDGCEFSNCTDDLMDYYGGGLFT